MDLVRALPNPAALWHRLTQRSNSNFKFAFLFLGPEQRDGLQQVYEFCRVVDDIVDERAPGPEGEATARKQLAEWSAEVARIYEDPYLGEDPPRTELGRGLVRTNAVFHYPREAFDEIIAGVAMDLERSTYDDMAQLRQPGPELTDRMPYEFDKIRPPAGFEEEEDGKFKTPSLLFVAGTPPYYHDGHVATLDALILGNNDRMGKTSQLSAADKKALIAYLKTL